MSNSWINLTALWKIVVFGLLLGAGLPALFAVGLRVLSTDGAVTTRLANRIVAGLCFAAVLAAIGWGIYTIVDHS